MTTKQKLQQFAAEACEQEQWAKAADLYERAADCILPHAADDYDRAVLEQQEFRRLARECREHLKAERDSQPAAPARWHATGGRQ